MTRDGFDPITFELIKNSFGSIVDEMALIVVRTAYSGVLKDVMDFSTALCDVRGQMIAQGLTIPLHLGSIPDAIAAVIAKYGDDVQPGDVFALNDPFEGGMHLPDIFIFKPIFFDGRPVGYAATISHHTDVGGRVAGSNASDSTEIYAEGLRIPPLKLYERGRPNDTLFSIIERNVRVPIKVLGDLRAQLAACYVCEQQFTKLLQRYGPATIERYKDALFAYSERVTRAEIAALPDGEYCFEDWIDEDGIDDRPIPLRVKVTVAGDELTCDFTGSSPQVKGAINATLSFTKAAAYGAIKYVLGADIPNNAGFFRPIHIVAPRGTILNCVLPAACAARGLTGLRTADLMFGVLAQIVPQRAMAASEGGPTGVSVGGYDAERRPFVFVEFISSGWGGRSHKDGIDGITTPISNNSNTPAEVVEAEYPITIERYEFAEDSGGPGRFRGALGLRRDYRLLEEEATLQVRADRQRFRPFGLFGGQSGAPSHNVLVRGEQATRMPAKFTMTMRRGDVFQHAQPGAGGLGDPLARDPAAVLHDVRNEKVSLAAARREYGVAIDPATWTIDAAETARLRATARCAVGDVVRDAESGDVPARL
ncbi:MAG: hydantoinase B/oxoprolinase family protein [Chloroflexi bacterium]|nr:hydantoinase B/oxoprolinase family protein [Chloroflexota bacterium]